VVMLVAAGVLAALTLSGATTQGLLLGLTFAIGLGQAMTIPSWQAIQPELVDRPEIPQAATLNGVNFNVARALGPALGGALIAALGPAAVFALNAASFLTVVGVLAGWERRSAPRAFAAEHIGSAIGAGYRFVRSAPVYRRVLIRALLFVSLSSALWALLPVVARGPLELSSSGYGLLLASVGVGAVGGAFLLPRLRERLALNALIGAASIAFGAACVVLATVRVLGVVVLALGVAGLAWIAVMSSFNASAQMLLPNWARARGFAWYSVVFMGGQALGSSVWGLVAQHAGLRAALLAVGGGLATTVVVGRRLRLVALDLDLAPARHWPEPQLVLEPEPDEGPVLVTVEYRVDAGDAARFREAMRRVERARRRTGARRWDLYQDGADPTRFLELYSVATWEEHLRQHDERITVRDEEIIEEARRLVIPGTEPRVSHLLAADRRSVAAPARPGPPRPVRSGR